MGRIATFTLLFALPLSAAEPVFRAGAASVDVTPERFPVVVNCQLNEQIGKAAADRLQARALVLDDGTTKVAVVVVDSCMMPREFIDRVKESVAAELKIPADRQMISATHTHTAPAVMGCLGTDPDPAYGTFLERQIVLAVRTAAEKLTPAKAGWGVVSADAFTNNRQWILRADKARADPFGDLTVKSNMHPGHLNPDFVGPSGPTDPWLSVLSLRTADDRPLAVLANFSMHYFGSAPVSADYFGKFCAAVENHFAADGKARKFVALMSQGTAGDLHWMDYGKPRPDQTLDKYATAVADVAVASLKTVTHRADVTLAMAETKLSFDRRTPSAARLEWAKKTVATITNPKALTQPQIYAREAVFLHAEPKRELKIQALRVGDLGIAAIPNEVFALTGLKIKAQSPLAPTFTVELANGADGYIPPPEHHPLGGYTTWPARSAALETGAEPKIVEAVLAMLEKVAGKKRRPLPDPASDPHAKRTLAAKPAAYWRLGELAGPTAADAAGKNPGSYEEGVVFGLPGPAPRSFDGQTAVNRAAHFAGGRMTAKLPPLGDRYSVEVWFWNGAAGETTGTLFSLVNGDETVDSLALPAKTLPFRTWTHALLVRDGARVTVYVNGKATTVDVAEKGKPETIYVGGRPDKKQGFEGRLAEVVVFDRALTAEEAAARAKAE